MEGSLHWEWRIKSFVQKGNDFGAVCIGFGESEVYYSIGDVLPGRLDANLDIWVGGNVLEIQFNRFKVEWIPQELAFFRIAYSTRTLMKIKKDTCERHSIVFSVDLDSVLHSWKKYAISQCKYETYSRLIMFIWWFFVTYKKLI